MTHDMAPDLDWCTRCGRPRYEIMELDALKCDGLPGVIHARYLTAKREMWEIVGPIVGAVFSDNGEGSR